MEISAIQSMKKALPKMRKLLLYIFMNVFSYLNSGKFSHSIDEKNTAEKEEIITVFMSVFFVSKHWKSS